MESRDLMDVEEIDLGDILKVLYKRRKFIVGVTLIAAFSSGIISLFLPRIYKTYVLIEPAKVQKIPVETVASTALLLKNPLYPYLVRIAAELGIPEKQAFGLARKFKLKQEADFISLEVIDVTPEKAVKLAEVVTKMVIERHNELVGEALIVSDDEYANLKEQIAATKKDIENLNTKISRSENTSLEAQATIVKGYLEAKENLLKRQSDLYERLFQKDLERKYFTKPSKVIAVPTKPLYPESSRRKIVMIATGVGFIISLLLTFVIEYFEKNPLQL